MVKIGYHGSYTEIENFDLKHLGSSQGQSRFPGIYFSDTFLTAKTYADLAVDKHGGTPIVYVAECELLKPLDARKGFKVFNSFAEISNFAKQYFPQWFERDGGLSELKVDYLKEKLETYSSQYELLQYASDESGIPLIEICNELGFDSWIGDTEFVVTNPQQILSFMEVDHQLIGNELEERRLPAEEEISYSSTPSAFETTSNQYIQSARKGKGYKTMPGNRFLRRVYIKMNGGNNIWFDIDMNRLFKKGSFAVKIPVVGETSEYVDSVSFDDWLPKLKEDIAKTGFSQMTVKRSLMEMLRFHDLKVRCTCPDFKYRHAYWLTVHNEIEGEGENLPSDETNPKDDLGKLCKHLSFVLNNKIWGDKESRIIYNYLINLKRTQRPLFDRLIAPKLGLETLAEEKARLEQERLAKLVPVEPDEEEVVEEEPAIEPQPEVEQSEDEEGEIEIEEGDS